jgi:acyl-coenzyme A thioesterase PaaI-like protein
MTKQIAFTEATVHNADGDLISRSTGTFMIHRAS